MNPGSSVAFKDTKKHYIILDALRGVAALVVVLFHLLETFTFGNNHLQIINHGYLAVDFFFVLSGFVIGYAYDDRWNKMSLGSFFKRRLIRLHPMIIVGMLIGGITFFFQASPYFPGISEIPVWKLLLVTVLGFALVPVGPSLDIRAWNEMYPTNGPAWTLFFEYIANILYALFIRKFSNKVLAGLALVTGAALVHLAVTRGDIIGGWALDPLQLRIGFTRLLYPFFAGLLLSRIVKPGSVKNAFLWCSILLVTVLSVPRLGGTEHIWINGLYIAVSVIVLFPLIVYMGASGEVKGRFATKLCRFLGDISYPIYIIHYPLMYLFMAWVSKSRVSLVASLPMALLYFVLSIVLAYVLFKIYDVPVRKWLTKKTMNRSQP
ncbi:MAG TPA: acyltransferase [Bacteroidales bacterium]|nr:acyltransferase [Bacteroidales bacterium]HRW95260.1 acyltransferase [Bacteroidales bacterium]